MDAPVRTSMRLSKAVLAAAVGLGGLGFGVLSAPAAQAAPATVTYTAVGETPFVVPAGVTSLSVTAVGAAGAPGGGTSGGAGGPGAVVTAPTVPVTPGTTLYVEVGAGGGTGGSVGGGAGGGESDIRTCPRTACTNLGTTTDPRLLVAGGGGGGGAGGAGFTGGAGGNGGVGTPPCADGGGGGTANGGAGGDCPADVGFPNGTPVFGGSAAALSGAGGGGGGFIGGLTGTTTTSPRVDGGGGGGSSFVEAAATGAGIAPGAAIAPASLTISYDPGADLSVTKAGSGSVRAGGTTTYTMTVANNGPDNATGVTLTENLPTGMGFVSASPAVAACVPSATNPVVVTCAVGTMTAGTAIPVYLTVTVSDHATGTLINTAAVLGDQPDPNMANNTATMATTINPAFHGEPGPPGRDGHDGHPGRDGHDGLPGHDGNNGRDGHDGNNGRDGHDGRSEHHHGDCFDSPEFPFCEA